MILSEILKISKQKLMHIEDGALDVHLIVSDVLGLSRTQLITRTDMDISTQQIEEINEKIDRRALFEPTSYILNNKNFMGFDFYVDKNVLIPRGETELLCEKIVSYIRFRSTQKNKIKSWEESIEGLEFGVGSGAISISLLHLIPSLYMEGLDISAGAIEVALRNSNLHKVNKRFRLREFDALCDLQYRNLKPNAYDFIVSNPPYIESKKIEKLMPDVKNYEPVLALDGGEDGLLFYKIISKHAQSLLKSDGFIAFEIGYNQGEDLIKILEENSFKEIEIIKDYEGNDRIAFAIK